MTRRTCRRPGYTLLEILVASVIGLLLMAALYAAFTMILNDTSVGRDQTAESNLSRGIINRVGLDLGSPVGMLGPRSGGDPGTTGGSTSTDSSSTTPATESAPTDPATTTGSTDGSTSPVTTGADIPFQAGIVGTNEQLVIFLSRPPEYLRKRGVPVDPTALAPADITRVTYYMHSKTLTYDEKGNHLGGLCRQERPWVTSDGIWNSTDPDRATEDADLIAPEVERVSFEYASGSGYTSSWDGSAGDASGATNQGPPRAVRMTITLGFLLKDGGRTTKDVAHVFPIRSAIGTGGGVYVPPSTAPTDSGSTTGSTGGSP